MSDSLVVVGVWWLRRCGRGSVAPVTPNSSRRTALREHKHDGGAVRHPHPNRTRRNRRGVTGSWILDCGIFDETLQKCHAGLSFYTGGCRNLNISCFRHDFARYREQSLNISRRYVNRRDIEIFRMIGVAVEYVKSAEYQRFLTFWRSLLLLGNLKKSWISLLRRVIERFFRKSLPRMPISRDIENGF